MIDGGSQPVNTGREPPDTHVTCEVAVKMSVADAVSG